MIIKVKKGIKTQTDTLFYALKIKSIMDTLGWHQIVYLFFFVLARVN